jgi:Ni/Co efflux regulator RcnB
LFISRVNLDWFLSFIFQSKVILTVLQSQTYQNTHTQRERERQRETERERQRDRETERDREKQRIIRHNLCPESIVTHFLMMMNTTLSTPDWIWSLRTFLKWGLLNHRFLDVGHGQFWLSRNVRRIKSFWTCNGQVKCIVTLTCFQ